MLTPRRILVVASTFPASPTDATPRFVRDLVEAMHLEDPSRSFAVLAPHVGTETVTYQRHEHFEEFRFGYVWPRGLQRLTKRGIMPAIAAQPWMLGVVPFLFLGEYLAMRRLVRTWKPDVIHAQWFTPQGVVAAMVARATGVPWVLTTHASDVSVWHKLPFFGSGIVRALLPTAQRITAVSTGTLARARGFFDVNEWAMIEPKVRIIPMGAPAIVASAGDATGTTAESHALANRGAQRSLLFIAVCGEEMGLLGSEWYVEHPLFPLADTVAELQMDMVGRWEEAHPSENPGDEKAEDNKNSLHLVGAKKISTQLHEIVIKANADHVGFDFEYDGEKYYTRSDHYNFAKKGIPVTFMFTGVHRDYHMVTDTPDKIDFPKLSRVAKLNYLVAWEIADRKDRLVKDVKTAKPKKGE